MKYFRCAFTLLIVLLSLSGTEAQSLDSRLYARFDGHEVGVVCISLDSTGNLITAGGDGLIKRWNVAEKRMDSLLSNVKQPMRNLVLLPSEKYFLSSYGVREGVLFSIEQRKVVRRFPRLNPYLISVALEGQLMAIKSGKNVDIYDLDAENTPKAIAEIPKSGDVQCGVIGHDGTWFVGIRSDDQPWLWRLEKVGEGLNVSEPQSINEGMFGLAAGGITNISVDRKGTFLAFGGIVDSVGGREKSAIDIWSVQNWSYKRSWPIFDKGIVDAICLSPDGSLIAASGDGGISPPPDENLPREDRFAIRILRTSDFKELEPLRGHRERVMSLQFSADGKSLVSGSADKSAIVWKLD